MPAGVVYESMFGNTAAIARAIAEGMGGYATVEILDVATAADAAAAPVDLLMVGAPTHAFGLSRRRTRCDAAGRTTAPVTVDIGVREWLDAALTVPTAAEPRRSAPKPPRRPGCRDQPLVASLNDCAGRVVFSPTIRRISSSPTSPDHWSMANSSGPGHGRSGSCPPNSLVSPTPSETGQ
ncbi:flavodoxin family protein [Nocardia asiatica]|uniref:flavodoxin family protein n=1 Tax=Nocardia asiatica TaxID=209252 RepID=UPI0024582E3D|nr:hypothetical protein [Nocardia asiatica]